MKKCIISALVAFIAIGIFAAFKNVLADDLQTYTVKSGDSLSSIATSQLGDPNKWSDIYNLNKDQISNPDIIFAGELLILPIPIDNSVQPAPFYSATPIRPNVVTQNIVVKEVPQTETVPAHNSYAAGKAIYEPTIFAAAAMYRVDPYLMESIIACESGYNPNAYNMSGATGIAQFMYGTYYGSWNPYRTEYNIWNPVGQIYAMALKISLGGAKIWQCYKP